jgi:hypothetical protein
MNSPECSMHKTLFGEHGIAEPRTSNLPRIIVGWVGCTTETLTNDGKTRRKAISGPAGLHIG